MVVESPGSSFLERSSLASVEVAVEEGGMCFSSSDGCGLLFFCLVVSI